MAQIQSKPEASLEKQLEEADTRTYSKKRLEESNHYNKVVLTQTQPKQVQNASLMELSNNLNEIVNETEEVDSNYANQLKKEVVFREREMRFIVVEKGDTLSKIAKKAYGNSDDYPKIFSANPEIIKNPNQIYVGQRLRIPS
ncbi:MAG TPA: LysM peptidoglycan-binding domain-containing protein [Campylobacterales bacterium]|nr:LysM peptidoglycan-binding domain-containing protein [Campylobacterales bacterium]HHS92252.1 LysM peptidoglycan-binding domain-containing protein [Campylobacterales bacterium]